MPRPGKQEYAPFYSRYVQLADADNLTETIHRFSNYLIEFFGNIPAEKAGYRYAEGKWSLKEMLQHIIDAERVFSYRALRFARKDATPLPGFEENDYALHSNADSRSWEGLVEEFKAVRKSTDLLFKGFNEEQLRQTGICNNNLISVNALGYISIGHILHHINVVSERYLQAG